MSIVKEPDQTQLAALVNGLATAAFAPRPYRRTVRTVIVQNSVPCSVSVYRGSIGSLALLASNPLGGNYTFDVSFILPAGQSLFVIWSAAGSPVGSAFAKVSAISGL